MTGSGGQVGADRDRTPDEGGRSVLRVVRGRPTTAELAAVVVVLRAAGSRSPAPVPSHREPTWAWSGRPGAADRRTWWSSSLPAVR
ncbi:MAG: acyl-CoA carboxylase epsilon subunit [Angustibacter sp.]